MTQAFQQVLGSELENYHKPKVENICGVKIYFKPEPTGVSWSDWRGTLEEWLPQYDEHGLLDELRVIIIGDGMVSGDALGQYNHNCSIDLENDVGLGKFSGLVNDGSREAVLTHEVIHHAHLTLNGYENSRRTSNKQAMLKNDVSWYAGTNVGEAIAEIGTGIVHGEEFPEWVHDYYRAKDGPMEAYDIA